LSWVGFWINKNSDPARVSLGVTTVLTMTTIAATSKHVSVSYLKAFDVWYAACMVFVFGALLEYAFVNVFVRSEKQETDNTDPVLCIYTYTHMMVVWRIGSALVSISEVNRLRARLVLR